MTYTGPETDFFSKEKTNARRAKRLSKAGTSYLTRPVTRLWDPNIGLYLNHVPFSTTLYGGPTR
ncbi:hypothetical protein E4U41_006603 [Claviceps citrina]|nr:hypothetical protein E4U41_006603 [Claviceps citrina]